MIQDIGPKQFHVEYHGLAPRPEDTIFMYEGDAVYVRRVGDDMVFPKLCEFGRGPEALEAQQIRFRYLFSVDEERFFIPDIHNTGILQVPHGYETKRENMYRVARPRYLAFAGITALQLYQWYSAHKYCGRCGTETGHSDTERAILCPQCGYIEYPKISPVVIVAVVNGDSLLVTQYRGRAVANRYALVAGFGEIGESLEDTVRREVFEETGIHVKNLHYYKSQPWGFSSSLLSGFFCELDGDPKITVDENELSVAIWLPRREIPAADSDIALTTEMMELFRTGKVQMT